MKRATHYLLVAIILTSGFSSAGFPVAAADDDPAAGPRALSRAFRSAAQKAIPSVVTIIVFGQSDDDSTENVEDLTPINPNAGNDRLPATGLGSGVIIRDTGIVLTNNHVVRNAKRIVVKLQDGTELTASDPIGDPDSDIATLKVSSERTLAVASFGDSALMEIGDWVLAIGSPFQLEATVSAGIISAKERTLPSIERAELFQTDAVINPGNSGGPLINIDGEVIGINTAIATRNGVFQGIGFAIPIDQAHWIADELLEHGKVRRSRIGVRLAELNRQFSEQLNLEVNSGVVAYQITDGGAADRAGVQALDVITEFAGQPVRQPFELRRAIERKPAGSVQPITVIRDGQPVELEVELTPIED
jgi:serine protease Do